MFICLREWSSLLLPVSLPNYVRSASCHLVVSICATCYTQASGFLGGCLWSVCLHHVVIIGSPILLLRIWISVYVKGKPLLSTLCFSRGSVCEGAAKKKPLNTSGIHQDMLYFQRLMCEEDTEAHAKREEERGKLWRIVAHNSAICWSSPWGKRQYHILHSKNWESSQKAKSKVASLLAVRFLEVIITGNNKITARWHGHIVTVII